MATRTRTWGRTSRPTLASRSNHALRAVQATSYSQQYPLGTGRSARGSQRGRAGLPVSPSRVEVLLDRCPSCGRKDAPLTTKPIGVFSDGVLRLIQAPWCAARRCQVLSKQEKRDPGIRKWWTKITPEQYDYIDKEILAFVKRLRTLGLGTIGSCSGHGEGPAYIEFYSQEDRDRAYKLLQRHNPEKYEVDHYLLGRCYGLRFNLAAQRVTSENVGQRV